MNPLAVITVIDLATGYCAAVCSWMLAELGAEVIRIEQPEDQQVIADENPLYDKMLLAMANRYKTRVCLDLDRLKSREALLCLLQSADVKGCALIAPCEKAGARDRNTAVMTSSPATVTPSMTLMSWCQYFQNSERRKKTTLNKEARI